MTDVARVLRGTPYTAEARFYSGETLFDPTGNAVTVTATKADGTVLLDEVAATKTGTGVYTVAVPAQTALNKLKLVWEGLSAGAPVEVTTWIEIVGGFYFSIAQLRAADAQLSDTVKWTTTRLLDERQAVENEFERITGRAFVKRFARDVLVGDDTGSLWLTYAEATDVTRLTVDGVSRMDLVTDGILQAVDGNPKQLTLSTGYFLAGAAIVVEYEYGADYPPYEIYRASLKRAKGNLFALNSRIDERSYQMSVPDFGVFQLATPGKGGSHTGIPSIDEVLNEYSLDGGANGGVTVA